MLRRGRIPGEASCAGAGSGCALGRHLRVDRIDGCELVRTRAGHLAPVDRTVRIVGLGGQDRYRVRWVVARRSSAGPRLHGFRRARRLSTCTHAVRESRRNSTQCHLLAPRRADLEARSAIRHLARPGRVPFPHGACRSGSLRGDRGMRARSGGCLVVATFAEDGPTHCSGLPVVRYSASELEPVFAPSFSLVEQEREEHVTPGGVVQPFTWAVP